MPTGAIRFYNEKEGYGFIRRDGPGADVFVHVRDVDRRPIGERDRVEFDIVSSERGPRAENVVVIDE
jgi:CspA family cold shock protein